MNRKQRRALRNAPKRYTETDMLEESRTTSRHNARMMMAALCITLHELHGFGPKRLTRVLERIGELTQEGLCAAELTQRVREETGLDILSEEDEA